MGTQGSVNASRPSPERLQASERWRRAQSDFETSGNALHVLAALTDATDEIVRDGYRSSLQTPLPHGAAMFAVGAYGRGETFPYSGADIVIVLDGVSEGDDLRQAKGSFARVLWDAGLRLNYSVRTLADCVDLRESSLELAISLLDRRFLAGDLDVRARLEQRLPPALSKAAKKIALRLVHSARTRHAKFGDSPQQLEPDVKEAPGGWRDLRIIDWLATLFPEVEQDVSARGARPLIATARCLLHYRAGRDVNLLDADAQAILGEPPYSISMREYFRAARLVFSETRRALLAAEKTNSSLLDNFREQRARLSNSEFTVTRDRVLLRNPQQIETDAELPLRLAAFMARHGMAAAPETERRLERARDGLALYYSEPRPAWAALAPVFAGPHATLALRTLHTTGVLGALVPEWADVEDLPLALPGRSFTADEHAFRSLEALADLANATDPARQRFQALLSEVDQPALLAFAIAFADMPAGRARDAAERLGMPAEDRATAQFLIERQNELPAGLTRDLDDPATIAQIAHSIGTVERLRMLTALAYAGLAASDPGAATPFRLEQLYRLYSATRQELTRELETERIEEPPGDLAEAAGFVKGLPSRYLRARSTAEITADYRLYERSRPTGAAVQLDPIDGGYRLTIVARDLPCLFASFAAAITSFGLDILKAEAFSNAKGVILDTFVFADPKRMLQLNPPEVERLKDMIQRVAIGKTDARRLLRATPSSPHKRAIEPEVRFDSTACETATLVEIITEDRPGLLYSLATVFSTNSCNIDVVLIDTKGKRAIDVFYVAFEGRKLSADFEARLREKLLAAC